MNDMRTIAPIVEGVGEVYAIPVLVRRICHELLERYDVEIRKPWRLPRGKIVKPDELSKAVLALSRSVEKGGILLVLDQDDDACAMELANSLNRDKESGTALQVVVAAREYEAWFLAAVSSLTSHRAIRHDATYEQNPESPRDAKGRLGPLMTETYRETIHQAAFSGIVDLTEAQSRSRSFRRLVSAVEKLCLS